MRIKQFLSSSALWHCLRERRIVRHHKKVAWLCEDLIEDYKRAGHSAEVHPKVHFDTDRIIWQYWAQGYDSLPSVVKDCLESVDKFAAGYQVIRLSDANLENYVEIPEYIKSKRDKMTVAHFSDILRVLLLRDYGGVWLDATVLLTGPIPSEYLVNDFFAFQRDPDEPEKKYWENSYAYYFGWAKGFRVNMLSSILYARKASALCTSISEILLYWWENHDYQPDYFFFQILFDTMVKGEWKDKNCAIVSDCIPHYLQQSINDPSFNLAAKSEIESLVSIHKLTYK